jgi:hypothetical protein
MRDNGLEALWSRPQGSSQERNARGRFHLRFWSGWFFRPKVSYSASYVELIEDKYTVKRLWYRPPSTESDTDDHCVFWVVENLHELPTEARIRVFDFSGYGKGKAYKKNFVPHRPLLVEHPHLTLL